MATGGSSPVATNKLKTDNLHNASDTFEDVEWPLELEEIPPVAQAKTVIQLPPEGVPLSIDHVRVSENVYAFRLRWSNPHGHTPKRPAIYYQYVHKSVFELIAKDKQNYAKYKESVLSEFCNKKAL